MRLIPLAWLRPSVLPLHPSPPLKCPIRTALHATLTPDEKAYIFQKSPFHDVRLRRQSTAPTETPAKLETPSPTTPTFATHADLLSTLHALTNDPLEADGGRIVVHRGSPTAKLMVIGEAPGEQEDKQGRPFVGRAGQLLDRILTYGGFDVDSQVYVTNVAKRRPSGNRTPTGLEIDYYMPFLEEEVRLVDPKIIMLAGGVAAKALLGDVKITKVRGCWFEWNGINVMPVFHPAYLLRNPIAKHDMVDDIEAIRDKFLQLVPQVELKPLDKQQ